MCSPPLLAGFRCLWWCAVPRHSWLGPAGGGGAWRVVCGVWCVVCGGGVLVGLWLWLIPRHSWRRFLCSTPRHSWLGFDAGGGGRSSPLLAEGPGRGFPPLLAGVRWRPRCVVGLWLMCGVVGPSPPLADFPVCYSPPLLAGFRCRWWCAVSRHSWLGPAGGGGAWCVVCGVRRWCVGGVVGGVWCGWSLATPGGGSCVLLPATPGWVSLPVVVGGPRHSWLGSAGGGGVWCVAVVCWLLVPRHSWRRLPFYIRQRSVMCNIRVLPRPAFFRGVCSMLSCCLLFFLGLGRAQVPSSYCMHFTKYFGACKVQLCCLGGSCARGSLCVSYDFGPRQTAA